MDRRSAVLRHPLNITAGLGAIAFAWIDDWLGAKPTILISLAALTCSAAAILLVATRCGSSPRLAIGIFLGPPRRPAARSWRAWRRPKCAPSSSASSLAGKTTFLGPPLVGRVTYLAENQRLGMATILPFLIVGGMLLCPSMSRRGAASRSQLPPMFKEF